LPIRIAVRTHSSPIPFRRFATAALSQLVPNPTIYLCSGVWHDNLLSNSDADGLSLRDELAAAAAGGVLQVVGTRRQYFVDSENRRRERENKVPLTEAEENAIESYAKFMTFVDALKPTAAETFAFPAPLEKVRYWHAKIILVQVNATPVVAVIGSSNMTWAASAYRAKGWNHESDVIIWSPNHPSEPRLREALGNLDAENVESLTMQAILDPAVGQPNEDAQLLKLRDEIITPDE